MSFIEKIKEKAKNNKKTIVLVETNDFRTLEAASKTLQEGFANIILVGDQDEIKSKSNGLDLSKAEIINPKTSQLVESYSNLFVELRGHKGMTKDKATDLLLNDPLYFGVALVKDSKADGMVAGAINSTANVLRAGLQIIGTAKDVKVVSSMFLMIVPNCDFGFKCGAYCTEQICKGLINNKKDALKDWVLQSIITSFQISESDDVKFIDRDAVLRLSELLQIQQLLGRSFQWVLDMLQRHAEANLKMNLADDAFDDLVPIDTVLCLVEQITNGMIESYTAMTK